MRKIIALLLALTLTLAACCASAETFTGADFSVELPAGMTEQPELSEAVRADVASTDDTIEILYAGATSLEDGIVFVLTRASKEIIAETEDSPEVEKMPPNGTYDQKLTIASEMASWYNEYDPLAFVVDVTATADGLAFYVCHCENENGSFLSCETGSDAADYTLNAYFLQNGMSVEPTQEQYDALLATINTFKLN